LALVGFVLACAGSWVHSLFTSAVALPVDPRTAGIALWVAGGGMAALGVYKARKIKFKRVKTTAAVFAGITLVVIALAAYHYYGTYSARNFTITSGTAQLSGTLFMPRGLGPHPAAVFIHGTTDRLRTQGMVYADYLARRGIAIFVYDKRGTGSSTGDAEFTKLGELATDAVSCFRYLQSTGGIDSSEMGFIGESQGGVVAGLAAREAGDCKFLVGIATPGLSLGEQMLHYHRNALAESGEEQAAVDWANDLRERIWAEWPDYEGYGELYTELDSAKGYGWYQAAGLPTVLKSPQRQMREGGLPFEWMNPDLNHDPLPVLAELDCPMLFMYGADDGIVPVEESERRLNSVLGDAGIDYTITVFDGADHSMYLSDPEQKSRLPKLPADLLPSLGEWIENRVK
jgi:pimeloyl-ACP methyl ester carboxylesterase